MRRNITSVAMRRATGTGLAAALAALALPGACQAPSTGALTRNEEAVAGAPIHGYVGARVNGKDSSRIMVPGIEVWAHDDALGTDSAHVATNPAGYFQTPPLVAGTYRICVKGTGYAASCDAATVTVTSDIVVLDHDVSIDPIGGAVWGTVRLADGKPCFWDRVAFRTLVMAKVALVDAATGALAGGPVSGNSAGQYVIPTTASSGSYKVQASCQAADASVLTTLTMPSPPQVDLVVPNRSPEIEAMDLTKAGAGVRRADPGDGVAASTRAHDPDGDELHYTWVDESGRELAFPDAADVSWPLYNVATISTLAVQVSDGRGGFAVVRRHLPTDDGNVVFTGRVIDRATGAPLDQVDVSIAGVPALTGPDGGFEITVHDSMRFVLNANKLGHALTSRTYNVSARGLEIPLDRAQVAAFDAAAGGTLHFTTTRGKQDKPLAFDMQIDPGSFVDESGLPYGGPATMEFFQYDTSLPYPIPGDQAGEWGGAPVRLQTSGSFHLTPRDKLGRRLQMMSGKSSLFQMDIEPGPRTGAPATIPLFLYDEATGIWKEHGTLTRSGDRYVGRVKHFTPFNADTTFTNSSCLRLDIDAGVVSTLTFPLLLSASYRDPASGSFLHNDTAIPDLATPIGIVRLAPNVYFDFEIRDRNHVVLWTGSFNSGPVVPPSTATQVREDGWVDDPNFAACHPVRVRLGDVPEQHPGFLVPTGTLGDPDAYRRATQAQDGGRKATLDGWKRENGFPNPDEASAIYFNDGDLKFGRDMHCRRTGGGKVACYVSNFGIVGHELDAAVMAAYRREPHPVATVCMEYDPGATAGQQVQFWAYDAENHYLARPTLDSEGPKPIPEICLACHQGFVNTSSLVSGSVFLPFDIESFKYDAIGDPFAGPAAAARQTDFRRLNALILETHSAAGGDKVADLINRWYPGGVTGSAPFQHQSAAASPPDPSAYPFDPAAGHPQAPLYDDVVATVCRTCHIARPPGGDWTEVRQMTPGRISPRVCGPISAASPTLAFSMPHAEVPFKRFWQRNLDDILVRELPLTSCPDR